ncbi:hypothetical protein ES705_36386 [subsurface metagenome]
MVAKLNSFQALKATGVGSNLTKQNKTSVLISQVELERTSDSEGGSVAVAVSGNMARGAGEVKLASSLATNRGGGGGVSSSLVKGFITARKRGHRMFHRVMSGIEKPGELRLITLTTAKVEDNDNFQRHFRMLRMRLLRRGLLLDYIRCREVTKSGLRHEHILFRGSYIEQVYLSHLWAEIHGAPVVFIQRVSNKKQAAGYLAKYASKGVAARTAYSWGWVWRGFCHSWELVKKAGWLYGYTIADCLTYWRWCVTANYKPDERMLNYLWAKRRLPSSVANIVSSSVSILGPLCYLTYSSIGGRRVQFRCELGRLAVT